MKRSLKRNRRYGGARSTIAVMHNVPLTQCSDATPFWTVHDATSRAPTEEHQRTSTVRSNEGSTAEKERAGRPQCQVP